MKIRIVYDGKWYFIQERYLLFWWRYVGGALHCVKHSELKYTKSYRFATQEYEMAIEEAQTYLKYHRKTASNLVIVSEMK